MKIIESLRIAEDYNVITEHKESDLKKRFIEVVEERNELLDRLMYVMDNDGVLLEGQVVDEILPVIEQITKKSWDEIKRIRG